MKLKSFILIILLSVRLTHYGQSIEKCDGTVLLTTGNKIGQLTQREISNFLLTFGQECRNNVEYSEWSNELLFSLLDKQTELTVRTIEKEEKNIELEEIFFVLKNPIHDGIDIKNLIGKVNKVKFNTRVKKEIIDRLKTAESLLNQK